MSNLLIGWVRRFTIASVSALLTGFCMASVLPVNAYAQRYYDDVFDRANYEDIVRTRRYYNEEISEASYRCQRARYDRAVLGLTGLLGQVDKDLVSQQAKIKRFEEHPTSNSGLNFVVRLNMKTHMSRLTEIRKEIESDLRYWKKRVDWAHCSPPPSTTAVPSSVCPQCKALDDEIGESQRRIREFEKGLSSKPQTPESKRATENIIQAIKRTLARLQQERADCDKKCIAPPATTPQVGIRIVEPKISIGGGGSSGTPTYASTGGQAPFSGDRAHTPDHGQVCGGATFYPGFVIGAARVGLDVNVCSGSNTFGSRDNTLFTIMRHGPGDVDLHATTNVIIDVLLKGEIPVGPSNNLFLSGGVGPAFRELNLTLTSNQSFFGGGVPSISDTTWQTGLGVGAGLSMFVCPNCVAGNPLKVGVEGRARFFPADSVSLRSPAFGFTETGSTGRTTDYSGLITFSTPIAFGPAP